MKIEELLLESELPDLDPQVGDYFDIELNEEEIISTYIESILEDGSIVLAGDDTVLETLDLSILESKYQAEGQTDEGIGQMSHDKLRFHATVPHGRYTNAEIQDEIKRRKKTGEYNSNYKAESDEIDEAKYHGREVPRGKPMQGDVKKSKVYVRKPNGKIVKVNFGDKTMRIKKSNPKRRKSFRARHNCANPGPRWKARYWSCRAW